MPVDYAPSTNWWMRPSHRYANGAGTANGRSSPGVDSLADRVTRYYLHNWKDFRGAWMNSRNRAMHFGYWDASVRGHHDSLVRNNQVLASLAGIDRFTRCLDLGAGVGGTAMWIAETFGAEVTGLTLVPDQAARIAKYSSERGLAKLVRPQVGDYHRIPFPAASFDVVYSQEAICHAADPIAVLNEARRVLRPGGRVAFAEFVGHSGPKTGAYRSWLETWAMQQLVDDEELRTWASSPDVVSWELLDVTAHVIPSLQRLRVLAKTTLGGQRMLARAGLRSATQIDNIVGSIALYDSLINGDWYYGMFRATVR